MLRMRQRWIQLTVLAALAVSAGLFLVHLHLDAQGHPESCAVCAAAHHAPAVTTSVVVPTPVFTPTGPLAPGAETCAASQPHPVAGPRAPPLS